MATQFMKKIQERFALSIRITSLLADHSTRLIILRIPIDPRRSQ